MYIKRSHTSKIEYIFKDKNEWLIHLCFDHHFKAPTMEKDKPSYQDLEQRVNELEKKLQKDNHRFDCWDCVHFKYSIDHITDSIFWIDPAAKLVFANQAACKNLEYSMNELLELTVFDFAPAFPPAMWQEHWTEMLTKGNFTIETVYQTKTGRQYPVEVIVNKIEIDERVFNCAIAREITERKQRDQELVEAKEKAQTNECKLKEAQELAKIGSWELELANNRLYWSDEIYRIFGCEPQGFGATYEAFLDFIHPEDRDLVHAAYQAHLRSQAPYNIEHRIVTQDGRIRFVNERCRSDFDAAGKPIRSIGTVADITDRVSCETELKQARDRAEENEIQFRNLFQNSPIGISITGINGSLTVNASFSKLLGYTEDELKSMKFGEITHPEDVDISNKVVSSLLKKEKTVFYFEKRYLHKNGSIIWADVSTYLQNDKNGQPQYFITTINDITEKKKYEQELIRAKECAEESEQNYKLIFNSTGTANAIFDQQGILRKQNQEPIAFLGKDGTGSTVTAVFGETVGKAVWERMKRVLASGISEVFETEFNLNTGKKWFKSTYQPMFDENKKVIAVQIISQNITELKNAELELIKAKERAEESDQLKTAFLQNMSHEIRTPLNAISGFSSMLNKPELSEDKRKNFVQIIQSSSSQLIAIVSDILTISSLETKQERLNVSKVCINTILLDLLTIFNQQANRQNISLYAKHSISDKQSEIFTDKTKLIQILSNLLSNALKFTHKGSVEFGYDLKGHQLEFYVKDTGIGINPEFHEKIFERFRQADKSINKIYGGTGLGLAISKAFVELLGGEIWVRSALDMGSSFHFSLPYRPADQSCLNLGLDEQNQKPITVLVAEDEEYNFLLIEEVLSDFKLKLIHAKNGKETVEIFQSEPQIDLILMDIKMPIMDGHEAAQIIKSLKANFPIIAQSAYALDHEISKYEGAFDDYITKPIDEEELRQKVIKYIGVKQNKI